MLKQELAQSQLTVSNMQDEYGHLHNTAAQQATNLNEDNLILRQQLLEANTTISEISTSCHSQVQELREEYAQLYHSLESSISSLKSSNTNLHNELQEQERASSPSMEVDGTSLQTQLAASY